MADILTDGFLQLEDLTPEQFQYFKQNIYNGVGSREFPINPRDFIFKKAALRHDFYYFRLGDDNVRYQADLQYKEDGLAAIKEQPRWKQPFYRLVHHIYCFFLFKLGPYAWEYGPQPVKTWEQYLQSYNNYLVRKTTKKSYIKKLQSLLRKF